MENFISRFLKKEPIYYGSKKISKLIRDFVSNDPHLNDYAWDDFTSSNLKNSYEEFIQKLIFFIEKYFPAHHKNEWCNKEGGNALLRLAEAIDSDNLPFPPTEEELEEMKESKIPDRYRGIIEGENTTLSP